MKFRVSANIKLGEGDVPRADRNGQPYVNIDAVVLPARDKAIEISVFGEGAMPLAEIALAAKAKRVSPLFDVECDAIAATPSVVPASDEAPAHTRTYAGQPSFKVYGNVKLTLVGKEPYSQAAVATPNLALLD